MLKIQTLIKTFRTKEKPVLACDSISLEIPDGKLFTLLGPSGCGKTSTMRCVAGLERPDEGVIQIGSRTVFSSAERIFIPPEKRKIGMVFQSYGLWPHLNVLGNVGFPLRVRGVNKNEILERVQKVLDFVGLSEYLYRPVSQLSGGQQQRVALARAIVSDVDLLLFDEPLSNLDAKIRVQVRQELKEMQSRLGITTLYVTHDQEEALAISDYIAVMQSGRVIEWGEPETLYQNPRYEFTANFLGTTNFIDGASVISGDREYGKIGSSLGELQYNTNGWEPVKPNEEVKISIRPEDIMLRRGEVGDETNVYDGIVKSAMFLGSFVDCEVQVGSAVLKVRIPKRDFVPVGESVKVILPPHSCLQVKAS